MKFHGNHVELGKKGNPRLNCVNGVQTWVETLRTNKKSMDGATCVATTLSNTQQRTLWVNKLHTRHPMNKVGLFILFLHGNPLTSYFLFT